MFEFPYYRRPFPNYPNIPNNPYKNERIEDQHTGNSEDKNQTINERSIFGGNEKKPNDQDCLFELFGLKIYTDDILILALLYFLYTEGIKDDYLFIILILLLFG